jgi:hypothetical protein
MGYEIRRVGKLPGLTTNWNHSTWQSANEIHIESYLAPDHDHKPVTRARLLHDGQTIAVQFRVEDRYIIARATEYQDRTHKDSCVEFFIEPVAGMGYFNFEFNCCGILLLSYIEDSTRKRDSFEKYTMVPSDLLENLQVHASLQGPIQDEIESPLTWTISYRIPKTIFEHYLSAIPDLSGLTMRGNFYKCADESSHPHWGYWADIGDELNFHQPQRFAEIHLQA